MCRHEFRICIEITLMVLKKISLHVFKARVDTKQSADFESAAEFNLKVILSIMDLERQSILV